MPSPAAAPEHSQTLGSERPPDGYVSRFYLSTDGLKLHFRDYAGPPNAPLTILCLPGLTRNARDFEKLAPHLAKRYRVLCAEFRGRGQSAYAPDHATYSPLVYMRDMSALLKAAGVNQVALIGTSLGGMVSTLIASIMPWKVLGIVINDIGPEVSPVGLARIAGYLGKGATVQSWDEAASIIQSMDGVIYPDYTKEDWVRMAQRRYREMPDGSLRPDYDFNISKPFDQKATPGLWPFFERLSAVEALALRGGTSDLLSAETFALMGTRIPSLRRVEVPNRGHTPNLDEPAALDAIDAFLAQLPHKLGITTRVKRAFAAAVFLVRLKLSGTV